MRVFGRIEDAYTEKLLPGAIVTLRVGDTELIEHTPSRDGQFAYEIPDEAVPIDEDILTCIVEKKGYRTQTSTYTIMDDIEIDVELIPILINWKRIFLITAIILGVLLLLAALYFGYKILFPPKVPRVTSFEVEPAVIQAGGEAAVKWETVDAEKVFLTWKTIDPDKVLSGEKEVEPTGVETVKPTETRRYRLTLLDENEKTVELDPPPERQLTVKQPPPIILSFTAKPMEIHLWDSAVLEWQTTAAETIYIFSDPDDKNMKIKSKMIHKERTVISEDYPEAETAEKEESKKELNGAIEVFPLETTTFTLAAVNADGEKREQTVELTVLADPEIISFTASENSIDLGESVILRWNTRNADQVFLNGERTSPRYSTEVRPDGTTTYILTARNKVGQRQNTLEIIVCCPELPGQPDPSAPPEPPRIDRFHISLSEIAPGEPTMLSWVTDHAEKVYLTIKPAGKHTIEYLETKGVISVDREELKTTPGFRPQDTVEAIAGKPLATGRVFRVKPMESLQVSPLLSTQYELRVVNPIKTVTWTRTVEVLPQTCTVILYELENYKGEYLSCIADAGEIGKLNNRVSSIKIIGNCGVKVFSAPYFKATHQEFQKSVPRLRGTWIGNNAISSFKIIENQGVVQ